MNFKPGDIIQNNRVSASSPFFHGVVIAETKENKYLLADLKGNIWCESKDNAKLEKIVEIDIKLNIRKKLKKEEFMLYCNV
jgi:hypothetical protein